MQDIKEVVNRAVSEAIHQELPKSVEEKLNANFFIKKTKQNVSVREILDCFECIICNKTMHTTTSVSEYMLRISDRCIQGCIHPSCSKCRSENDFIAIKLKGFDILSRLNKGFTWQIEARKHYFSCVQSNMLLHPTTVVNAFEKLKVTNLTWKIYAS